MAGFLNSTKPKAARLHYRRRAKLIFPWGLLLCALMIFLYANSLGFNSVFSVAWLVVVGLACLLYEVITPHSRIVYYTYRALNRIFDSRFVNPDMGTLDEVYSIYSVPKLFSYRHSLRWVLTLVITILTWVLILYYGYTLRGSNSTEGLLLLVLFALFSTIPLGILALEAMRNVTWAQKVGVWYILIVFGGLSIGIGVWWLVGDWPALAVYALVACFVFAGLYLFQRLWIGESIISVLIRRITIDVLSTDDVPRALEGQIPQLVGKLLRYDRVTILIKHSGRPELTVIGTYGDIPASMIGEKIERSRGGITWRAVDRKNTVAWNNTRHCPYYLSLLENEEDDDTRAEIATPIIHRDTVYGILDVQSRMSGVYGPGDAQNLSTIAQIIGSAMASYQDEQLLKQAGELWNRLIVSTSTSEAELFEIFAGFASEHLGTDAVVYYPLSPTGFPNKKPLSSGVRFPNELHEGITNFAGPLVQLIQEWEHHPSPDALADKNYLDPVTLEPSPFVLREEVKSSYFVPIGIETEPLGALFLNFRKPAEFDDLFILMVVSFSQAFATISWKNRYRKLIYEGFGSPAYDVHYKRGLYGLKTGVSKEFEKSVLAEEGKNIALVDRELLKDLCYRVDRFLDEIQFEEELVPPDFWNPKISLERELVDFINSRPPLRKHERQPNVKLKLDYRIERENPIVKLALYRVVSEAINNAIVHGQATNTKAQVFRQKTSLDIMVTNDGEPLSEDYRDRRAALSKGILYLFDMLAEGFGADTSILTGEDGSGAIVQIQIPALPDKYHISGGMTP